MSSDDLLAQIGFGDAEGEQREQAVRFLLYLTALEHVASHAEELETELRSSLHDPPRGRVPSSVVELHRSRWYTFVIGELLSRSEASVDAVCSVLSSKDAHDAVIALLARYRRIVEALDGGIAPLGFPDAPSDDDGVVADLVRQHVEAHRDPLTRDDLGGVRSLARAERLLAASHLTHELLGFDDPLSMLAAAQMHADIQRFLDRPEPLRTELPWDDATRDALRLPLLLLSLGDQGDPERIQGPFGRLSAATATALSAMMRRLHHELGPDELRSPHARRRAPTDEELQRFFDEAIQETYAAGLDALPESAFLTERLSELAGLVVSGSDAHAALADLLPRLREARAAWLLELDDRDFATVIAHLDAARGGLATQLRRRFGVLLEEIEPARRRECGRLRSWTHLSVREWFDFEVRIPQLHVRVLSGSVPILDTVDDVDDIIRLGSALISRSLESLDAARESGSGLDPTTMTRVAQDLRELVDRIGDALAAVPPDA